MGCFNQATEAPPSVLAFEVFGSASFDPQIMAPKSLRLSSAASQTADMTSLLPRCNVCKVAFHNSFARHQQQNHTTMQISESTTFLPRKLGRNSGWAGIKQ